MLETMNDYLSFGVLISLVFAGIYLFIVVFDKHRSQMMIDRQERYYAFYENMDDEYDNDRSDTYYE
jgi:hypothetical protein